MKYDLILCIRACLQLLLPDYLTFSPLAVLCSALEKSQSQRSIEKNELKKIAHQTENYKFH